VGSAARNVGWEDANNAAQGRRRCFIRGFGLEFRSIDSSIPASVAFSDGYAIRAEERTNYRGTDDLAIPEPVGSPYP